MKKLRRTIQMAIHALRSNILRSSLTTLGIVIGIAAVISMMEIGQGSSTTLQQNIKSMGADNLMVLPGTASSGGVSMGTGSVRTLTPGDVEAIARECPAIKSAAPIVESRAQIVYGNRNWVPMEIFGTTPVYLTIREWQTLDQGEPFTDLDVRNSNRVCVIGQTVAKELFEGESPIGATIRVQNVPLKVIGILSRKGANMVGMDQDDTVLIPWTTVKYRISGASMSKENQSGGGNNASLNTLSDLYPRTSNELYPERSATQSQDSPQPTRLTNIDQIALRASSTPEIPDAIKQVTSLLRERHRIRGEQADDFNVRDMTEMTKMFSGTTMLMTRLLLFVALISLMVGGVGIMNIMMVSVTERTKEIGLRMAVGANDWDILQQFLIEAIVLCLLGGTMGILFGRGISILVGALLGWPISASIEAIVAAVVVSASVGIGFGFYPAWKASRLDPIDALRYE
ncbi:MAG: ABC transporter permease [Planctomycetes bacterium]|nr:ABC transporter permease [Planctomycetota bacterium]